MPSGNTKKISLQEKLERQIIEGLSCEWETALWVLNSAHQKLLKKPFITLSDMRNKLGYWSGEKYEICLSRNLVYNHRWDTVREILRHEMAHQLADQVLGAQNEPPHGPRFQEACRLLRANPKATGEFSPLEEKTFAQPVDYKDRIMLRVKKLLALAESKNRHEAEMAMLKAHELIKKYNIEMLSENHDRNFISIFLGKSALRHFREEYQLAHLIQDFYFVQGIWVSAYVLEKGKMGRVLELSGTVQNIKIAEYVYDFVNHFINSQWESYNTGKKLNRYRKSDFAVGLIEGFRSSLESKNSGKNNEPNSLALVALDDPLLNKYMNYRYPHTLSFSRYVSSPDEKIYKAGKRIGEKLIVYKGISEKGVGKRFLLENN